MISRDEDPVASCVPHCYTQDVSLACSLPPGAYSIVPSTYQPDCSAGFTLSLARRIQRLTLSSSRRFFKIGNKFLSLMMVDLCVSFRKVVKSQERLGKAVQEVSEFELCIVLCNTRNSLGGTKDLVSG